jgi:hypothetical protein
MHAMPLSVLVAYSASSTHVATTRDYLSAIRHHSGFDVSYVHVTHDAVIDFDLDRFDIVFHNYCARLCFPGYVSQGYLDKLRRFRGLKILSVQDEYDHTDNLKGAIKDLGFHIVLTCVPKHSLHRVYPRAEFENVTFETVLTGYVPDHVAQSPRNIVPLAERPIVIGYRGRDIGALYGRLAFEKFEIGRRMKEICTQRGIVHDIAVDEESRIYEDQWFDFIGSCRAMLGTESGSNVFDFDGSLRSRYQAMAIARNGRVNYEEFLPLVAERESEVDMRQISPRIFECAVMRTPMILFRGRYSGVVSPDEHYIPLEKDFSNIDEVFDRIDDLPSLEQLQRRAYEHVVGSGRFGYKSFWALMRALIEKERAERALGHTSGRQNQRPATTHDDARAQILREIPTETPLGLAHFEGIQRSLLALSLANQIDLVEREIARITDAYQEHTEICFKEARRLADIFKFERARVTDSNANGMPAEFSLDALVQLRNAFDAGRSSFEQDRRELSESDDLPRRLRFLCERIGVLNGQLGAFNAGYQSLIERVNFQINHIVSKLQPLEEHQRLKARHGKATLAGIAAYNWLCARLRMPSRSKIES